jgi:hypothetical protein
MEPYIRVFRWFQLQKRLLELNLNIFLSYENDVDQYNFTNFVREKNLFTTIYTMRARINAEVELARAFIKCGKLDKYGCLPPRDFNSWEKLDHLFDDQIP